MGKLPVKINTTAGIKFPIHFLLGFSRSGTSLVMTYLRGHSSIETGYEEPNHLYRLMTSVKWEDDYASELGIEKEELQNMLASSISLFTQHFYKELCKKTNKKLAVLKHPWLNPHAPKLAQIFPEAKFIILLRHPYDVIASCIDFRTYDASASSMFPANLNKLIHLYLKHMKTLLNFQRVCGKDRILFVRFEDFLKSPRTFLQEIFTFLGVKSQDSFTTQLIHQAKNDLLPLVGRVLITSNIVQPEKKFFNLTNAEKQKIRGTLKPFLPTLGYDDYQNVKLTVKPAKIPKKLKEGNDV